LEFITMTASHFSSDQFAVSRFPLHGRTEAQVQGRLLRCVQWGPFNLELVQAQCRLLSASGRHLPTDLRYLELIEFRDSLLMPSEGWRCIGDFIEQGVVNGFCAQATVLVADPNIEGYELFWKRCESLWSRSRPVHSASTRLKAEALVQHLLAELGLDDDDHRAALPQPLMTQESGPA
jgi:hypothetical protein